jgi:uncharacterized protein YndB with AHSA1/START domain
MYTIKHLFHINADQDQVVRALTTIEGLKNWWTTQTLGDASQGGTIEFRFGDFGGPDMKVTEVTPDTVTWQCIASAQGWTGNSLTFKLDRNEGKTRVRFSHDGFKEQNDVYSAINFTWARYMESLRQFCQTGKGEPFGNIDLKKTV